MRGYGNNRWLDGATYIERTETECQYRMISLGGFPGILDSFDKEMIRIQGEVYEVDAKGLSRLDRLEGAPDFYHRKKVLMRDGAEAWIYLLHDERRYTNVVPVPSGDWRDIEDPDFWDNSNKQGENEWA